MTSPELLRFFQNEAAEYLDAIEALLSEAAREEPGRAFDGAALLSAARALRGAATMARVPRVAELALLLERVANAIRDGEMTWSEMVRVQLGSAVSGLRSLVAAASQWSDAQDGQAARIAAEVQALLPRSPEHSHRLTPPGTVAPIFIALQTSAIAAALDRLAQEGPLRDLVSDVIARLRALHGMAGFDTHRELSSAAQQLEELLRELPPDTLLEPSDVYLLRAGALLFHKASVDLRTRGYVEAGSELANFAKARATRTSQGGTPDVVPIEQLFYEDSGPHIVKAGNPPAAPPKPVSPPPEAEAALPRSRQPAAPEKGLAGSALQLALTQSLARLRPLDEAEPLAEPAPLESEQIVPIESLLYRGDAALRRAIEIRDALRASGKVEPQALDELYDLLDLARTRD
jgi:HPt (histidine-containing phosphotransfer) domain-containing protein